MKSLFCGTVILIGLLVSAAGIAVFAYDDRELYKNPFKQRSYFRPLLPISLSVGGMLIVAYAIKFFS